MPTHRRSVTHKKAVPLANTTKNRYLSTIGRILSLAEEAAWISQKPKLTVYKEKKDNIRWLRKEEVNKLLSQITLRWLHDCAVFALATGCRANEIFTLTWDKINIHNKTAWITNDLAKSGLSRSIPLNDDELRLILTRPKISPYIFCRKSGLQLTEIDREHFNSAIKKAGLAHLTFHDLRHTWASWHVQSGTPLYVLKELGVGKP